MGEVARRRKKGRKAVRTEHLKGKSIDRIRNYYMGRIQREHLGKEDLKLKNRWENIWTLYKQHMKTSVAVKYHMTWCKEHGQKISDETAYNDLRNATKLWGDVAKVDRQAKLMLLDEMATDTYIKAKDEDDINGMNRAIANLTAINEQVQEFAEDHREPHTYELHLHIKGEKRILDLNNLPVNSKGYDAILEQVEEEEMDTETFAKLLEEDEGQN